MYPKRHHSLEQIYLLTNNRDRVIGYASNNLSTFSNAYPKRIVVPNTATYSISGFQNSYLKLQINL